MLRNLLMSLILGILLSQCAFSQEARTTFIPMEDGISLATDIWMPDEGDGPWPVILVRTPYSRNYQKKYGRYFSQHGYVVAVQDVRGQYDSEGEFEIWVNEKEDGYYSVEWLAGQKWCNGKVGMIGGSYGGYTQTAAAVTKPSHLVTIIPKVTMADPSVYHVYPGGVFAMKDHLQAMHMFAHNLSVNNKHPALPSDWKDRLDELPVIDLDKQITGKELKQWRTHIQHKPGDPYWKDADFLEELEAMDIPVFLISGWFDFGGIGTKETYLHLKESKNKNIKLLLGPWAHQTLGKSKLGPYDFGEEASMDIDNETLRWFDYWMKGEDNGIMDEPLVQVFATGPNKWVTGNTYPIPESKILKYNITSSALSEEEPEKDIRFSSYTYNPGNPTPSIWYDNANQYEDLIIDRQDILIIESEVLKEDVMLLGPVSATIFASSSAPETDWFVYLLEIDSTGSLGSLMLRGQVRAKCPENNSINKYTLDLWHTGYLVPAGNKFRVLICSAAFPRFSRNLNTGEDNETSTDFQIAEQKIYHSAEYPSSISVHAIDIKY